jgi:hypothetical protein
MQPWLLIDIALNYWVRKIYIHDVNLIILYNVIALCDNKNLPLQLIIEH